MSTNPEVQTPAPAPAPPAPSPLRTWLLRIAALVVATLVGALLTRLTGTKIDVPAPEFQRAADWKLPPATADGEPLYYCGRVETLLDHFTARPWPVKQIPWTVNVSGYFGPLSPAQVKQAFELAWKAWAQGLDLEPAYVASEAGALVRSKFGQIDGAGKVLAWSELADGTQTPKQQLYDHAESWGNSDAPPANMVDLVRVAAHEIGHVIGLTHDSAGEPSLMAPMYSRTIRLPTPRDVDRAISLGYKRRVATPGNPNPAPTISIPIRAEDLIRAFREAGYKVEPVEPVKP